MWKVLTVGTVLLVGLALAFNLLTPWSVIPRHEPDPYVLQALNEYRTDTAPLEQAEIVSKSYTDQGWRYRVTFLSTDPELQDHAMFQNLKLAKDKRDGTYLYEADVLLEPHRLLDWKVVHS